MELFEQTTQYNKWRFSAEELREMRESKHRNALERIKPLIAKEKVNSFIDIII